jgi:hypothetical protein
MSSGNIAAANAAPIPVMAVMEDLPVERLLIDYECDGRPASSAADGDGTTGYRRSILY